MHSVTQQNPFAADVAQGLSATPKFLSSKYFYDDAGSRLFQEIMKLPEYYLTRAETEVFRTQTKQIFEAFTEKAAAFDLIELGAGDGSKTSLLVDYFLRQNLAFTYIPIDISAEALKVLTEKFQSEFPNLKMRSERGDYFRTLETFKNKGARRKIILFLGSNIGNFSEQAARDFFADLRAVMNPNDLLFVGFDLQKNPRTIRQAYDDAQGVTARFNLNLLARINRELGADFNVEKFLHYAAYHPTDGAARSFLVSCEAQTVFVKSLNTSFYFAAWEPVFMEISQKYSLPMIENLAHASGFAVAKNFFDDQRYFVDSLWKISV